MLLGRLAMLVALFLLKVEVPRQNSAIRTIAVGLLGLFLLFVAQVLIGKFADLTSQPSSPADPHYVGSVLSIINDPKTVAAIAAARLA